MKKTGTLLCVVLLSAITTAHEGAEGVVKERMDAMSAIGQANKPLAGIARGRADFDLKTVQENARIIADNAGASFVDLFPEGSLTGETEAKADIWENFDDFAKFAKELEENALALSQIESEAEFAAAFKAVGNTCSGCHKKYREKNR